MISNLRAILALLKCEVQFYLGRVSYTTVSGKNPPEDKIPRKKIAWRIISPADKIPPKNPPRIESPEDKIPQVKFCYLD